MAEPFSVKRDSSSASLALARFTESPVLSCEHFAALHQLKLLLYARLLLLAPSDETIRSRHDMFPPVLLLAGPYYPRGLPCEDVTPAYIA